MLDSNKKKWHLMTIYSMLDILLRALCILFHYLHNGPTM